MGQIVGTFIKICLYQTDNVGNFFNSLQSQPRVLFVGFGILIISPKAKIRRRKQILVFLDMMVTWPDLLVPLSQHIGNLQLFRLTLFSTKRSCFWIWEF